MDYEVQSFPSLDRLRAERVRGLVGEAAAVDGATPLNEAAMLSLEGGRTTAEHLVVETPTGLDGYANLMVTGDVLTAQLLVSPGARFTGIGTSLLRAAAERVPQGARLGVWAFGDITAARGFARARGLRADRELLIMEAPLDTLPAPRIPDTLTIRAFTEDDLPAILDINARAFAAHPEQGAMDEADFRARASEDWYRPEDLLVATRAQGEDGPEQVLGFHWTKRHGPERAEVYVLAVDPDTHGGGVGKALLRAGLQHMADWGARTVLLYVEGDQEVAVGLYAANGFTTTHRDVMYVPTDA